MGIARPNHSSKGCRRLQSSQDWGRCAPKLLRDPSCASRSRASRILDLLAAEHAVHPQGTAYLKGPIRPNPAKLYTYKLFSFNYLRLRGGWAVIRTLGTQIVPAF
ncbi:MAG: hypothetical protein NVSMB62_11480 [Acidobacteriaceae bacterium]